MIALIRNIVFYVVLCCVTLSAYFINFALYTTSGLFFLLTLSNQFIPGEIHFSHVKGTLLNQFTLENFSFDNPDFNIKLKELALNWRPEQLWHGKLFIEDLKLNQMVYAKLRDSDDKPFDIFSYTPPNWLKDLEVKKISLSDATFKLKDQTYQLPSLDLQQNEQGQSNILVKLTNGELRGQYKLELTKTPSFEGTFTLTQKNVRAFFTGSVNQNWNVQWQLQTSRIENYFPAVRGEFDLSGNIKGALKTPVLSAQAKSKQVTVDKYVLQNAAVNLSSDIKLNSELKNSTYQSTVQLRAEQLALTDLGLRLQKIILNGKQKDHLIDFTGQLTSGKVAKITGNLDTQTKQLKLYLSGKDLDAIKLSEYKVRISPIVQLDLTENEAKLTGTIGIPYASITPAELDDAVTLPSEVVFVHKQKKLPQFNFPLELNLTLLLENKAYLNYKNFKGNLKGKLNIIMQKDESPIANGELYTVDGRYKAYGQQLKIETGRITYAGNSLTNPGLMIRATKKIKTTTVNENGSFFSKNTTSQATYGGHETITAGIVVSGTFDKPVLSLFSSQTDLTQNDILSYLLFGYPQSQIKGNRLGILMQAAATLGPNKQMGIQNFTKKIQKVFGFSEFNIQSTDYFDPDKKTVASATTFGIGKTIGKNLSINYQIGISNPISILSLKYKLTKRLYLQSEKSPVENGVDLFYGFETD